jgi:hypothetical protein
MNRAREEADARYWRERENAHLAKIMQQGGFPVFSPDWSAWLWPVRRRAA